MQTYRLHKTASNTYRVLVEGVVHPLLVGFHEPYQAVKKLRDLFPRTVMVMPKELVSYVAVSDILYFSSGEFRLTPMMTSSKILLHIATFVLGFHPTCESDFELVEKHFLETVDDIAELSRLWNIRNKTQDNENTMYNEVSTKTHVLRAARPACEWIRPIHLKQES